jgi:GH3 auxin-responsive promoter
MGKPLAGHLRRSDVMNTGNVKPVLQNVLRSAEDCKDTQRELLLQHLIMPNETCEFGRNFGFSSIRSVSDYQHAVPVRDYECLRDPILRIANGERHVLTSEPTRRFFITGGSMAAPKYIPITPTFIRDKARAFRIFWDLVLEAYPGIVRNGLIFHFPYTGDDQRSPGGLPCSSESFFWDAFWRGGAGKEERALPREILKISDSETRTYIIARTLLETDLTVLVTSHPSVLVALADAMQQHATRLIADVHSGGLAAGLSVNKEILTHMRSRFPGNPIRARELELIQNDGGALPAARVWPNLQLAVSWRSPVVSHYIDLLHPFLAGIPHRDYLTMASEGIMAIPLQDEISGGILPIHTHFFEFIPEESCDEPCPATLLAHELEPFGSYVVVLSTSAGMYRYRIDDVVRVRGFVGSTPFLEFLHRVGHISSLIGEKLTESQVADAVSEVAARMRLMIHGFTLSPAVRPFPHYMLSAEFESPYSKRQLNDFLLSFDRDLGLRNIGYQSKRSSRRLGSPELCVLRPGTYAQLRQQRIRAGASEAQVKIASLIRDVDWHKQLQIVERISCESAA